MNKEIDESCTPCFVFNKNILDIQIKDVKEAFKTHWNNYIFSYSVKTNSLPPLSNYLRKQGVFAEVVSSDEFELVKKIGYSDSEIVCNGPIKSKSWLNYILENNLIINIDSFKEIEYVIEYALHNKNKKHNVGIRVNLEIESVFEGESKGGNLGSRFGFSYLNTDFSDAIKQLKQVENICINGLHLHISTHTRKVDIYKWLAEQFVFLVDKYQLGDVEYLDIGGGFFGGAADSRNWNNYIEGISEVLRLNDFTPKKLKLIIEPGVSLLASCFDYYTSVHDVKKIGDRNIILLDGSRIHIDPIFNRQKHIYTLLFKQEVSYSNIEQLLVGCTCMENDRFFSLVNERSLNVGDVVRFEKVGAYTMTLSPLFIHYFPPIYMIDSNGEFLTIRDKWGADQMLQCCNNDII